MALEMHQHNPFVISVLFCYSGPNLPKTEKNLDTTRPQPDQTQPVGQPNPSGRHTPIGAWTVWLCQGKYLDGLSGCSGKNKALVMWVFQPLPYRPVGFTLDLLYESGSPTPLKVCVVRVAVQPSCSRPSPVRFTAPVRLLAAPTAWRWD